MNFSNGNVFSFLDPISLSDTERKAKNKAKRERRKNKLLQSQNDSQTSSATESPRQINNDENNYQTNTSSQNNDPNNTYSLINEWGVQSLIEPPPPEGEMIQVTRKRRKEKQRDTETPLIKQTNQSKAEQKTKEHSQSKQKHKSKYRAKAENQIDSSKPTDQTGQATANNQILQSPGTISPTEKHYEPSELNGINGHISPSTLPSCSSIDYSSRKKSVDFASKVEIIPNNILKTPKSLEDVKYVRPRSPSLKTVKESASEHQKNDSNVKKKIEENLSPAVLANKSPLSEEQRKLANAQLSAMLKQLQNEPLGDIEPNSRLVIRCFGQIVKTWKAEADQLAIIEKLCYQIEQLNAKVADDTIVEYVGKLLNTTILEDLVSQTILCRSKDSDRLFCRLLNCAFAPLHQDYQSFVNQIKQISELCLSLSQQLRQPIIECIRQIVQQERLASNSLRKSQKNKSHFEKNANDLNDQRQYIQFLNMEHIKLTDQLLQLYEQQSHRHQNYHAALRLLDSQLQSSEPLIHYNNVRYQQISEKVRTMIETNKVEIERLTDENSRSGDLKLNISEKKKSAVRAIIESENDIERQFGELNDRKHKLLDELREIENKLNALTSVKDKNTQQLTSITQKSKEQTNQVEDLVANNKQEIAQRTTLTLAAEMLNNLSQEMTHSLNRINNEYNSTNSKRQNLLLSQIFAEFETYLSSIVDLFEFCNNRLKFCRSKQSVLQKEQSEMRKLGIPFDITVAIQLKNVIGEDEKIVKFCQNVIDTNTQRFYRALDFCTNILNTNLPELLTQLSEYRNQIVSRIGNEIDFSHLTRIINQLQFKVQRMLKQDQSQNRQSPGLSSILGQNESSSLQHHDNSISQPGISVFPTAEKVETDASANNRPLRGPIKRPTNINSFTDNSANNDSKSNANSTIFSSSLQSIVPSLLDSQTIEQESHISMDSPPSPIQMTPQADYDPKNSHLLNSPQANFNELSPSLPPSEQSEITIASSNPNNALNETFSNSVVNSSPAKSSEIDSESISSPTSQISNEIVSLTPSTSTITPISWSSLVRATKHTNKPTITKSNATNYTNQPNNQIRKFD